MWLGNTLDLKDCQVLTMSLFMDAHAEMIMQHMDRIRPQCTKIITAIEDDIKQ